MKAVFCDFYGTAVHENGPVSYEVIKRIYKSSSAGSPEEVVASWWKIYGKKIENAFGDTYRCQYDIAMESFQELLSIFQSKESAMELCEMMAEHWTNPPIYKDAVTFMSGCTLPVYFVTNSDNRFVEQAVANHGLNPAGIITSEQARYSKPKKEIFLYALNKTGLKPEEVVHVGDSIKGDVTCPMSVGIKAIWLNRENKKVPDGMETITDLLQMLGKI